MATKNWVSKAGLAVAISKIKELISTKADKNTFASESQSGLMTSAEHVKLKNLKQPTKLSELANDKGYITSADVPPGSVASALTPKMDSETAVIGTDNGFARGDHQHPTDTSRASATALSALDTKVTSTVGQVQNNYNSINRNSASIMDINDKLNNATTGLDSKLAKTDVKDWAKAPTKPTYTYTEVGAEKAGESAKALTEAKQYADTKISTLGTVYKVCGSVNNYSELPTSAKNGDVYNVKNVYKHYPAGTNFVKTAEGWDDFGGEIDLTGYCQESDWKEVTTQEIQEMFN